MIKIDAKFISNFVLMNQFFQEHQFEYCLIGGMAAGYWGEPRFTKDMDFTVVSKTGDMASIKQLFDKESYVYYDKGPSQIQIFQKKDQYFIADIILSEMEFQHQMIHRANKVRMFDVEVPICTPEDLIILKLVANRAQDLLDIENVLKNSSLNLDRVYLKKWFQFWEVTDLFNKEFGNYFKIL